ncbi:MAG: allophanate hydrolase subunit 1 [Pelagibacteraceae bacterium]|nr:allophanate hydrolase subunit 1 [Pelagibacteraceae bacterium]PHX89586.1 MAG: allophanate hydrolase [Pelagibacteraceae bacterium]
MIKNILALGDAAIYCDFGSEVNQEINSRVINYFNQISKLNELKKIEGITNLTPSYNKLIISFDLSITSYLKVRNFISDLKIISHQKISHQSIKIPVCSEGNFALDFERITKITNQSKEQILDLFYQQEYFCYMTGFIAGMPFLGDINEKIRCQRLETPRVNVPEGSVGITEQFTNIYTSESPGGWNIIGNTPLKIFNKLDETKPNLINPGDKITFYPITKTQYDNWK